MVECCWTAASSSLSKMVHSPMVLERWLDLQEKQDWGLWTPLSQADSFFLLFFLRTGPRSWGPAGLPGITQPPSPVPAPLWPLRNGASLTCQCVFSWARPAVLLFLVEERCWADCHHPPFLPSLPQSLPPPSPAWWCLSSPCRTTLFCATAYAIAHCMTAMIALSFPLASLRSFVLFLLLCPCLWPPPYPQGSPCVSPAPPAITAALRSSLHCVGSLPLLHPCCSNLNTHWHTHTGTLHSADPPWLTSANSSVNTHSMTALNPTLPLPTEDCRSTPAHKAPACWMSFYDWRNGRSHSSEQLQGPIKTCTHTLTHTHLHANTLPPSPSVINQLPCCIK